MWRIDREKGRILYVSREMGGHDRIENRAKKEEEEEGGSVNSCHPHSNYVKYTWIYTHE
jgi:hypothetical protein